MDAIDEILARARPAPPAAGGDDIDAILARAKPRKKESFDDIRQRLGAPAAEDAPAQRFAQGPTAAELLAEAARQREANTFGARLRTGAANIANTVVGGARAVGESVTHPVDTITDPARRRQLERGLDDMLTLGYGQKLAARVGNALGDTPDVAIGPETFGGGVAGSGGAPVANTQAADQAAAPEFRQLGNIAGGLAPGATSALAGLGTRAARAAIPAGGGAAGAVRGLLGYQAAAPATAALSANSEGNRMGAAADVATDPLGNLLAGGLGAAAGSAPARVNARIVQDVPHGEATAKLSTAKKFEARIGEDGEALASMLERDPKLERKLAVDAKGSPGRVVKTVQDRIEKVSATTDPIYEKIGGVDLSRIDLAFHDLAEKAKAAGRIEAVGPIQRARAALADAYGERTEKGQVIAPGTLLDARAARNFANGIGEAAFSGDPNVTPKVRVRAQQDLYRAVTGAIEAAAKETGADLARLKQANRDMSILLPMRDALKERAAKEAVGRTSLYSLLAEGQSGAAVRALAGGSIAGVKGAVAAVALPAAARGAATAGRMLDYKLMQAARAQGGVAAAAKLMAMARQGASDDEIQRAAADLGIKFAD